MYKPEENEHGEGEGLEVVVPMNVGVIVLSNTAKDLHPHHSINEEDECNEEADPW